MGDVPLVINDASRQATRCALVELPTGKFTWTFPGQYIILERLFCLIEIVC